jgi:hypothetical protein
MTDTYITIPYLIQRADLLEKIAPPTERLTNAVKFDYMGSAEFEYGALPQSLRRIEEQFDKFVQRRVPEIVCEPYDVAVRVWSYLSDEEFEVYKQHLLALRNDEIRTKEITRFAKDYKPRGSYKTNFWWDIQNDVMWSFDKVFSNRLRDYLSASFAYMNDGKGN